MNALPTNYVINSGLFLASGTTQRKYLGRGNANTGEFPAQGNKFIGVQFKNAGGAGPTHFGWIQVTVGVNSTSMTIIDWAWEDTPNTPILAGATGGGAAAAVVPTLNEWGLIVLTTLLAGAAVWKLRRLDVTAEA